MNDKLRAALIAYLVALNIFPTTDEWITQSLVDDLRNKAVAEPIGKVDVADGASKVCLIFKNFPFVIKWNTGDYDEAMKEVSIYQDAVAQGLGFLFPKTEFFYEHNGVSFVLQEKIDCSAYDAMDRADYAKTINRITRTPTSKIYAKMQREFNKASQQYQRTLNEPWAKMVISLYGKKVAKSLCQFVVANNINDLHSSNVGYKNFRPIILDFSGYYR